MPGFDPASARRIAIATNRVEQMPIGGPAGGGMDAPDLGRNIQRITVPDPTQQATVAGVIYYLGVIEQWDVPGGDYISAISPSGSASPPTAPLTVAVFFPDKTVPTVGEEFDCVGWAAVSAQFAPAGSFVGTPPAPPNPLPTYPSFAPIGGATSGVDNGFLRPWNVAFELNGFQYYWAFYDDWDPGTDRNGVVPPNNPSGQPGWFDVNNQDPLLLFQKTNAAITSDGSQVYFAHRTGATVFSTNLVLPSDPNATHPISGPFVVWCTPEKDC